MRLNTIKGLMLLIAVALLGAKSFAQDYIPSKGAGRIFLDASLPVNPPAKFGVSDHLYSISDSAYYQRVSGAWVPSYLKNGRDGKDGAQGLQGIQGIPGVPGQSIKGDKGDTGPTGPQGPAGSGGGGLPSTVGRIRYCYNETDLRNAVAGIVNNTVRAIVIAQEISITSTLGPIKLPNIDPTESDITIVFDLMGNSIFDRTTAGLPYVIGVEVTDQSMAVNGSGGLANRPRNYTFQNGKMCGTKAGAGTGTLLNIEVSQRLKVQNMHFENAKKGLVAQFCMFGLVEGITSTDIGEIVIEPTRGDWPGSGNNLCSSNQFIVRQVRACVKDGSTAIIYSKACSGHKYELITGECGWSQFGIYWDYNGANEVKNGPEINLCHWEGQNTAQFSVAFIYIRQGGGSTTVINQTNHQIATATRSPLIWVQGEGSGNTVKVNDLRWLLNDSKFQSTGQNFWRFDECYDGANLFTQNRWVGTIPNGVSTYNNGTSLLTVKRP